jgi:hypothetical protein
VRTPATERYRNDVAFRTLVDSMRAAIDHAEFTPSEIREAAMLAQIIYEETNLRPRFVEVIHGESMIRPVDSDGWMR